MPLDSYFNTTDENCKVTKVKLYGSIQPLIESTDAKVSTAGTSIRIDQRNVTSNTIYAVGSTEGNKNATVALTYFVCDANSISMAEGQTLKRVYAPGIDQIITSLELKSKFKVSGCNCCKDFDLRIS